MKVIHIWLLCILMCILISCNSNVNPERSSRDNHSELPVSYETQSESNLIDAKSFSEIHLNITDLPKYSTNWEYGEFEAKLAAPPSIVSISPAEEYALPFKSQVSPDGTKYAMLYQQSDVKLVESNGESGGINYRIVVHYKDGTSQQIYSFYINYSEINYVKCSVRWVTDQILLINNYILHDLSKGTSVQIQYPDQSYLQSINRSDIYMFTNIYEEDLVIIPDEACLLAFAPYYHGHVKLYLYNINTNIWTEIIYDPEFSAYQQHEPDVEKAWVERQISTYYKDRCLYICVANLNDDEQYGEVIFFTYNIGDTSIKMIGDQLLNNAYISTFDGVKYVLIKKDRLCYQLIDVISNESMIL